MILGYDLANLPTQLEPAKYERMVFGLILVLMMIFRPQGILPAKRRHRELDREALMPLLEARAVSKRFGGLTALNTVDFALEEGHIASIIGPNGAGKTTFFNVFTGIYVPEEGAVTFRGTPVLGRRPDEITALGICRTFQNIRLFPRHDRHRERAGGHARACSLGFWDVLSRESPLARAGAAAMGPRRGAPRGRRPPRTRPTSSRATCPTATSGASSSRAPWRSSPALLLLDEPTAGMTQGEARSLMALLRRLVEERRLTILLIEHNMRVVMEVSRPRHRARLRGEDRGGPPADVQRILA